MARRKKYVYNAATHKYEKWATPLKTKLLRWAGFVSASLVTGALLALVAFRLLESPKEKKFTQELRTLREKYAGLQLQIGLLSESVTNLEQRDNDVYRAIFEREPIPDSTRQGKDYRRLAQEKSAYASSEVLVGRIEGNLTAIRRRISVQQKSYDTLARLAAAKEEMLAHIPAIQPISNKTLDRIASGFGFRIDPVYKTPKLHAGLDFAAPLGTPIYATADGKVQSVAYDEAGYGNYVVLAHGYGYGTLYGHMIKVKAQNGQAVARGEVIGWVGSTGKSTGPHCHYEIIRNGTKIDPVHYFFNDLSPADYDRMVRIAASGGQSFD